MQFQDFKIHAVLIMQNKIFYFRDDLDDMRKQLEDYGVAVFRDVLAPEFCDEMVNQYQAWWATFGEKGPETRHSIYTQVWLCPFERFLAGNMLFVFLLLTEHVNI